MGSATFSDTIWDFTQPSDLTLRVNGKDFFIHRSVLIKASPVFQVMLQSGNFLEKDLDVINLPYKKAKDIQQLLNFMYPFAHQITGLTYCLFFGVFGDHACFLTRV